MPLFDFEKEKAPLAFAGGAGNPISDQSMRKQPRRRLEETQIITEIMELFLFMFWSRFFDYYYSVQDFSCFSRADTDDFPDSFTSARIFQRREP
jgi:hypothetical protein